MACKPFIIMHSAEIRVIKSLLGVSEFVALVRNAHVGIAVIALVVAVEELLRSAHIVVQVTVVVIDLLIKYTSCISSSKDNISHSYTKEALVAGVLVRGAILVDPAVPLGEHIVAAGEKQMHMMSTFR